MKKLIAIAVIGILHSLSANAAGNVGQCVSPKTKVAKNGHLEFKKPVYISSAPSTPDGQPMKTPETFTVVAENNGYIQLAIVPGWGEPNKNAGKIVGWGRLSDFEFQDLRNCN